MNYRFGECELLTDEFELRVGGQPVAVEPQVLDVIITLVARAGELVTRDELIAEVWGGRIVSESAISARISAARAAIGDDGTRQAMIRTVPRRGFRFVAEVATDDTPRRPAQAARQSVHFCRSRDGARIAYATTGAGYPLLRAGHWLTHLEHDWHSPVWRPTLDALGESFAVTRYDQRGNGLSDWDPEDLSLGACVADLEAVADAAGLDRFALLGSSQGAPIAIAYAVRHPERVSHLILHGGYQRGRALRGDAGEREAGEAMLTLIRHGWGKPGGPFIQAFASMFIPDGTKEQIDSLAELQRRTTSPENALRSRDAVDHFDVSELLSQVRVPTLVTHARQDGVHPADQGRKLAAGIAGAEFIELDSRNHIILEHDPAWPVLIDALRQFCLGGP